MKNKAKKISRKLLVKNLDTIVSLIVRNRDKVCVQCGTEINQTCGHVIGRQNYSLRWSLDNCFCQCKGHNLQHKWYPHIYFNWYIQKFGLSKWNELIEKSEVKIKYTDDDLKQMFDNLNKIYEELIREKK